MTTKVEERGGNNERKKVEKRRGSGRQLKLRRVEATKKES